MEHVSTRDQQWQVAIRWSPVNCRFDLILSRWERDDAAAEWALESQVVAPIVHWFDLEQALTKMLDEALGEMERLTGRPVRGPF